MKRGDVIADRFEIHEIAGSGAMGVVWRALDRADGRSVAVKMLRPGSDVDRFARESRLLSELDHPGIVRYVAHGSSDDGPYLVMEWLDGHSLAERLERAELTMSESVALVTRVASAIGAAHRRQVVHRDIKPSNVFLVGGRLDDVRVLDFGVARHGTRSSDLTQTGAIIGSPRYMAPEQARGAKTVGPRADVWGLGALLYRCLAGSAPIADGPIESVLADLLLSPIPRVSDTRRVPAELDDLCARLLSKDAADRPPDGLAVAEALARIELPALAEVPQSHGPERGAITLAEQRLTCAVVIDSELDERSIGAHHGGTIESKPTSTAIVFSTFGTASDLVAQAARCALSLRSNYPDAKIAIATGTGPVADLAHPERGVVQRAEALLETASAIAGVRLDGASVGLLDSRFEVVPTESGRTHALLLAEKTDAAPVRKLLGRPTPCVGRERELGALSALVAEAISEGVARAALVTGPPGIGKSRVRYELLRRLDSIADEAGADRPEVWLARGDPVSKGSPFGLIAAALREAMSFQLGASLAEQTAAIEARVSSTLPAAEARRIAAGLSEILGIHAGEGTTIGGVRDPMRLGDQMRAAWEDFLVAECEARPILLVLEDLHWGDWPSLRFVDAALRHLRDRPFVVVGLARPEVSDLFPGLWADRGVVQMPLAELGKKASERLVRVVLGDRVAPERAREIVERAGGNAFFLEELIRASAENVASNAAPPSVLAMAESRVAELEPEARQILRAASIFGQIFWEAGVAALLGTARTRREVGEWLVRLVEREFLTVRRSARYASEVELVFRHGLVRDAAYAMLTDEDRQRGHRLAATWLESVGEREPLLLASHFTQGGEPGRAAPLYRRAAEQALEGNDFAAVLAHAARALESGANAGDIFLLMASAHQWRGEMTDREAAARNAMAAFPRLSKKWYVAAAETARIASRLGRHDEMAALVSELAQDPAGETAAARAVVLAQLGVPAIRAGKTELAQRIADLIARAEPQLGSVDHEARAWLSRFHGYSALVRGDASSYLRKTEDAVREFEQGGDERNALTFQTSVGFANIALGQYREAEVALRDALTRAERMNLAITRAIALHNLGYAVALSGRLDEGIQIEKWAVSDAVAQNDRWVECVSETYLAELLRRAGRLDEAESSARRAIELSDRPNRALALAFLAKIELDRTRLDEAESASAEAYEIVENLGGIEDGDALVRVVRVEVLERRAEHERASELLRGAVERLMARAAKIADSALAKSFLGNVPEHARTLELARSFGLTVPLAT